MSVTAEEFNQYVLNNRKKFVALSKSQEKSLARMYVQFAEYVKLEAANIVKTESLTYSQRQKLIRGLLRKAADLTDDFKGVLDKALIESANLGKEVNEVIMQKYQSGLASAGHDIDMSGMLHDIPEDVLRASYNRIWEDGLKLSDRIYILDKRTKRELQRIITEEIAAGRSASSKVLEGRINKMLKPGRQAIRTTLHGRNVSFDAARLLRTERTLAFREADRIAAKRNPGAVGIKWSRSNRPDPDCEMCHRFTTQDLYGLGPGMYPPDQLPVSHPQCKCYTYTVTISTKELVKNWKEYQKNPSSHPELDDWYKNVYGKKTGMRSVWKVPKKTTPKKVTKPKPTKKAVELTRGERGHVSTVRVLDLDKKAKYIQDDALKAGMKISKKRAKEIAKSMEKFTGASHASIKAYNKGGKQALEKWLKKAGWKPNKKMVDGIVKEAKDVEEYLKFAPKFTKNTKLYRGITDGKSMYKKLQKGSVIDMQGSQSFSTNINKASLFADEDTGCIFEIAKAPNASTSIQHLSRTAGEAEVLVSHKVKYKFMGKTTRTIDDEKITIIKLAES